MPSSDTIDPEEYKTALKRVLAALTHHAGKAKTAKTYEEQCAHAQASGALARAFFELYAPGDKK